MAIWLRNRRIGEIAFVMAGLLAVSRVAVGMHYPSDVLAGALIGIAAALVFWVPPIRRPLHRFADWLAKVYDHLASTVTERVKAATD